MIPPALCISLDRSPARWSFMQEQFSRLSIEAERVPGIDGAAATPWWLTREFRDTPLTGGEIGCYASHLVCALRILIEGWPYAIILEDDVTLDEDFAETARAAIAAAPEGWDYLHLSSDIKRSVVQVADLTQGRSLVRHTRLPVNTAAYVVSHSGARKWLKPRPRVRPNDMDVRYGWLDDLDIYGVYPAPASQRNDFESDIGGTHGGATKIYDPRNFAPGIVSQAYGSIWLARKLGLKTLTRARIANITASIAKRRTGKRVVPVVRAFDDSCR